MRTSAVAERSNEKDFRSADTASLRPLERVADVYATLANRVTVKLVSGLPSQLMHGTMVPRDGATTNPVSTCRSVIQTMEKVNLNVSVDTFPRNIIVRWRVNNECETYATLV